MITGKKVIIAGIAGRVGSGIGEYFLKCGNEVWGNDLFYRPDSREYWEAKGVHNLVNHLPIEIVKNQPSNFNCIYDKDVNAFMEPLLNAATTESPIVNFIGDDCLSVDELVAYLSELTGIEPEYKYIDELSWPALIIDPEKRKAITGPSAYPWKTGVRETVEYWLPKLKAEQASADKTATASAAKYTRTTLLREISHLPGIIDFLSEKSGQRVPPYALKVGGGMTLQKAGSYLKWFDEQIQNVVDELNEKYR